MAVPYPLLVILGPTAVGKTSLGLRLARRLGGEIISADSAQVYRYMDIGTDKPPHEEMAEVPHHLVDIRDPDEDFTLADFQRLATQAIAGICARGRLPIMVGGTGLYIRAVTEGYRLSRAAADPSLRARLNAQVREAGPDALYRLLREIDPPAAERIHPNNVRRVIRALEIYYLTGVPMTVWEKGQAEPKLCDALKIGLTRDRDELYRRIEDRVDRQIERGLVEEVRSLLLRGYDPSLKSMQALGYKEAVAFIRGEMNLEEMTRMIKRNTRRYAKRQWTWFRREPGVIWLDMSRMSEEDAEEAVLHLVSEKGWLRQLS